jgi:putative transposase
VSEKRDLVREMTTRGVWERAACRAVGLHRSSHRYRAGDARERQRLVHAVVTLAHQHRRYGYRRITALLRRRGEQVNHKRVWAIWRAERLSLPRRRPRKRRGRTTGPPTTALHRNHVWTYDFLFDRTEHGQRLKILTVSSTSVTARCSIHPGSERRGRHRHGWRESPVSSPASSPLPMTSFTT